VSNLTKQQPAVASQQLVGFPVINQDEQRHGGLTKLAQSAGSKGQVRSAVAT